MYFIRSIKGICQNHKDELAELDILLITLQATTLRRLKGIVLENISFKEKQHIHHLCEIWML